MQTPPKLLIRHAVNARLLAAMSDAPTLNESQNWSPSVSEDLYPHLDEILRNGPNDLRSVWREPLNPTQARAAMTVAKEKLRTQLNTRPAKNHQDLADAWNTVVRDFYSSRAWGVLNSPLPEPPPPPPTEKSKLKGYLRTFLVPTLITKSVIFYFGLNYAMYPGEGYGWGLAAAMSFTMGTFLYFIWTHRHETEDPPRPSRST